MSYIVSTDTVGFHRGCQNHSGSVAIAICGVPTEFAPEGSFTQRKMLFGSHRTTRAGHRRVRGRNQHHLPARPHATFDKFTFRSPDRGVSCFAGHRRAGKKPWFEVFDCNGVMVDNNPSGPHARCMGVLAVGLLVQTGGLSPRSHVPLPRSVTAGPAAASHLPLCTAQFGGAAAPVPCVGQVVRGAGRCRGSGDSPVDADSSGRGGSGLDWSTSDKRGVPVAQGVLVDAHRCRRRRQFPRPDHRNRHPIRQSQPTFSDRETSCRVLQRRQGSPAALDRRAAPSLHRERMPQRRCVCPQRLLLHDLGALPQPCGPRPSFSEHLRQAHECRLRTTTLLVNGLVPQESGTMPLGFEHRDSVRAGSHTVGETHDLVHGTNSTEHRNMIPRCAGVNRTILSSRRAAAHHRKKFAMPIALDTHVRSERSL